MRVSWDLTVITYYQILFNLRITELNRFKWYCITSWTNPKAHTHTHLPFLLPINDNWTVFCVCCKQTMAKLIQTSKILRYVFWLTGCAYVHIKNCQLFTYSFKIHSFCTKSICCHLFCSSNQRTIWTNYEHFMCESCIEQHALFQYSWKEYVKFIYGLKLFLLVFQQLPKSKFD